MGTFCKLKAACKEQNRLCLLGQIHLRGVKRRVNSGLGLNKFPRAILAAQNLTDCGTDGIRLSGDLYAGRIAGDVKSMFIDPIVEEVRAIKKAHAEQYCFDIPAMYEALKKKEQEYADRLIECPPMDQKQDKVENVR